MLRVCISPPCLELFGFVFIAAAYNGSYQLYARSALRWEIILVRELRGEGDSLEPDSDIRPTETRSDFTFAYDRHCANDLHDGR